MEETRKNVGDTNVGCNNQGDKNFGGNNCGDDNNTVHIMNDLVENHFETEIENFLKGLDPKNKIELNTLYNEMVESLTKTFKEYSEEHY